MKKIKVVSLFSGIGGFETGIFNAFGKENVDVVFSSEIDKYASKSYETLYGHKPHGDITKIEAVDIPNHDLMVCGFPCQSFSIAGKREGFLDKTRGTLFFEIMRIAKVKRPKVMLLENVKGLISHDNGNTLETIALALNEAGYTFDMQVMNSKYFDVPQNRERIFFVCVLNQPAEKWNVSGNDVLSKGKKRLMEKYPALKTFNFNFPEQKIVKKRLKDILESTVPEKYYLSEEKSKKLVIKTKSGTTKGNIEVVGHSGSGGQRGFIHDPKGIVGALSATDYKQPKQLVEPSVDVVGSLDIAGNDSIKRIYSSDGVAPTLTTMGGGLREPKIIVDGYIDNKYADKEMYNVHNIEGISPTVSKSNAHYKMINEPKVITHELPEIVKVRKYEVNIEKLKIELRTRRIESGFTITAIAKALDKPKTLVEHWFRSDGCFAIPDADIWYPLKKLIGIETDEFDSSVTEFIEKEGEFEKANRVYDSEGLSPTLTRTSSDEKILETPFKIRKLTPLECFRLQGFPDDYYQKLKAEGISDSQLYKQAGNAVTTNVIEAIVRKLEGYL